jgi:fructose-1,6-bisphosphatase I
MATNGDMPQVQNEKINTDIVTLTRFLTEEQAKHKEATGDFTYAYRSLREYCAMLIFPI